MKESFVFYATFWEAVKLVPDAAERAQIFAAICEYALCGTQEVELSNTGQVIFTLVRPQLDANRKKYTAGCKGGRPKNTAEKSGKPESADGFQKEKPECNDGFHSEKPNVNDNVNVNDNENENENVNVNVNGTDAETATTTATTTAATAESTSCSAEKGVEAKKSRDAGSKVSFGYTSDKKLHGIDEQLLSYWQEQFPEVNVPQELRNAEAWLESNPVPRKKNIRSFLLNWLIRSQKQFFEKSAPVSSYTRLDGNTPEKASAEERKAFDGF